MNCGHGIEYIGNNLYRHRRDYRGYFCHEEGYEKATPNPQDVELARKLYNKSQKK